MVETVPPVTVDEVVSAMNVRVQNGVARLDFMALSGFVEFVNAAHWQQALKAVEPRVFRAGRNPEMRWIYESGARSLSE